MPGRNFITPFKQSHGEPSHAMNVAVHAMTQMCRSTRAGRGDLAGLEQPHIWIDVSGWSPKYFSPQLVQ